jgi:hypothetical protein
VAPFDWLIQNTLVKLLTIIHSMSGASGMKPLYKIFLVEDEIVTCGGIREHIDWKAAGFEFCGESPDGEIAMPMIQSLHPDVLIKDYKHTVSFHLVKNVGVVGWGGLVLFTDPKLLP